MKWLLVSELQESLVHCGNVHDRHILADFAASDNAAFRGPYRFEQMMDVPLHFYRRDKGQDVLPVDVSPEHMRIVRDILRTYVPQYDVWVFGSRARRTAKKYSDLDLAIITEKPLNLETSAALTDAFSESDLPYKVDVVDWYTAQDSFRKIIQRDKVVIQQVNSI